jgi:hypothetical protein
MNTLYAKNAIFLIQKRVAHAAFEGLIKKLKNKMKIGREVKMWPSITLELNLINVSVVRESYNKFN